MTREEAIAILIREVDDDPFMRTEYREQVYEALNIAIKALEHPKLNVISIEPSDYAISRTRWIPVSEKLPNDRDWYLGIFKEPDTGWVNPLPFICDYVGIKTEATTKEHWILRGFTDRDEHIDYYFNLECVKWMPLPKTI